MEDVKLTRWMQDVKNEIHELKTLVKKQQGTTAFYQDMYGKEHDEKEALQETVLMLTTRTKQYLQRQLFHDNQESLKRLAYEVLDAFLTKDLLTWDHKPPGIYWKQIASHFKGRERSVIRRLNELSKPHTENCKGYCSKCRYGFAVPPLKWTKPGYFVLNSETLAQEIASA